MDGKLLSIEVPRWKNSGESYLNSMLMCPSDRDVKEALTIPCTWATESRIRVHFEWVYDGDFVYLELVLLPKN